MTREALEVEALAKPKATRESHLVLCRRTLISQDAILRSPTAPTPGTGGGTDIAAKSKSKQHKYLQILNMIPKRAVAFAFQLACPVAFAWGYGVRDLIGLSMEFVFPEYRLRLRGMDVLSLLY